MNPALHATPTAAARHVPAASDRRSVAAKPHDPDRLVRAVTWQNEGRIGEAEALFREHLDEQPDDPVALYSLGVILLKRDEALSHDEALATTTHLTRAVPGFALGFGLHGAVLQAHGRYAEALVAWDEALRLKPDYAEILLNSGALLRKLHRHAEALMRFQQLLALQPEHKGALGNAAILLSEFKRTGDAIRAFEQLLALDPEVDYGLGLLLYERLHICDWTGYGELVARIEAGLAEGRRVCKSLALMAVCDDPKAHQTSARVFAAQHFPPARQRLWNGEVYRHRRIRLAYLSADFREHPVGHLVVGVIEGHDRQRFETYGLSIGVDDGSRLRQRFGQAFDHFIDLRGWGTRQAAQWIRDHEIDIVVDLGGYTSDARSDILAFKPAPVQVNWLGYPGTMGVPTMDYILADRHVIPPGAEAFYDEQVVRLPHAYLPTDANLQPAERTPTRAECGLPDEGVVFCCFNHDYKISPVVFGSWLQLLAAVPGSVLWLMSRNEHSIAHLRGAAQAKGIDPQRLVFAKRVPRVEDHLARYRAADLFLDTHPYNAHTTAADALMAGLVVFACFGRSLASGVATVAGVPELVVDTVEAYEQLAIELASDPARLAVLKARVARARAESPLFDTAGFSRDLEAAFVAMWRRGQLAGVGDALAP
jgi:protein O-GlcNAc transferase